jgi:hypothetical protein
MKKKLFSDRNLARNKHKQSSMKRKMINNQRLTRINNVNGPINLVYKQEKYHVFAFISVILKATKISTK